MVVYIVIKTRIITMSPNCQLSLAIYSSSDMEVEELLTQVLETGKMSILKV